MSVTTQELLSVENLKVQFEVRSSGRKKHRAVVKAVDNVSFNISSGETVALVGESGCGKSTVGNAILGLVKRSSGRIIFDGKELPLSGNPDARKEMQVIFQDPSSALNPKCTVYSSIAEPLAIRKVTAANQQKRVAELLDLVGLNPSHGDRYPHQFSGGQRQRVVIARALALSPKLLICDEPVSALDVSIRSQILNLLMQLQDELGLAYFFISHDLSVVRHIADRVQVMYLGSIVEHGDTDAVFDSPAHPYTEALLNAIPIPDAKLQRSRKKIILKGELPSPLNPPEGCLFVTRCPIAESVCSATRPLLMATATGTETACFVRAP